MARQPRDFYPTPLSAVEPLMWELLDNDFYPVSVLCPGAGDGTGVGAAARVAWPDALITGVEADSARAAQAKHSGTYDVVHEDDFLQRWHGPANLILMNPPFTIAAKFVLKAFHMSADRNTPIAALLRLGMLASRERAKNFWPVVGPPTLRILSHRPSFSADGRTDNTEYGWFIWRVAGLAPIAWY